MDEMLRTFLKSGMDLSPVGFECRNETTPYFCTPEGAAVFGWAGVDGIHFCCIRGFGTMVFSVNPSNSFPDCVHPLAKDFTDFLRLLLACGDTAALEQLWMWDETQFENFLRENLISEKQRHILSEISEQWNLKPMEHPWAYVKALQSTFDSSKLRYSEKPPGVEANLPAEPTVPEWKVYFDGNFWGHRGKDPAGKKISLGKQFDWAGYHWQIPALYLCDQGLVMDFCIQVDENEIRQFMEKWNLSPQNDSCDNFTHDQQLQIEWENPLCFDFLPSLKLSDTILQTNHGCTTSYNPCLPHKMTDGSQAKRLLDHYHLDSSHGWIICRNAFPWESNRCPEIQSLSLIMEENPVHLPGPHFRVHAPGDSFTFSHPLTEEACTLTVQALEHQTVPQSCLTANRRSYPTHCVCMYYTLSPEPAEKVEVFDTAQGDQPAERGSDPDPQNPVCNTGIIGGADGPIAIFLGPVSHGTCRVACSSLYFDPILDDVEWRLVFCVRQFEKASFQLI